MEEITYDVNKAKEEVFKSIEEIIRMEFQKGLNDVNKKELNFAVSRAVVDYVSLQWRRCFEEDVRRAYYFSAEYLIGRMVFHNLHALGIINEVNAMLNQRGMDLAELQDVEAEVAVIGNGGLGRLAACFLDSAAVLGKPLTGYGIKYRYGLFYQKIENGFQVEVVDDWDSDTNPWFMRRDSESVEVSFANQTVRAVPFDMPVIGYHSSQVNTLRLWQAEAINEFDFQKFNDGDYAGAVEEKNRAEMITHVLYPNDNTLAGKRLRLKQQYFFTSASLQDMLRHYRQKHPMGDMERFVENTSIQLNDTHPVVAIPELIRLLMAGECDFEEAFGIAQEIFNYTNHTIMSEALERWDIGLFRDLLPDVYSVIEKINARLIKEIGENCPERDKLEILHNGEIHMARMAVYCSSYVNGVAYIHTELLKNREMHEWYQRYPERFLNKTNGVAPRRWLALCNRELAGLLNQKIGDGWIKDFSQISNMEKFIEDAAFVMKFNEIKLTRKKKLAQYIKKRDGFEVNPRTIFDIQVKRLHEYKRQLLNAFSIMDMYFKIKDGELNLSHPVSFIFGSKAAPGYYNAKSIIKYINEVGELLERDEDVKGKLAVYFVSNYDVPYAEKLIPAADVSEQISTAGTEASGTGNMKFMMNGAVTLGTYDGANVEIFREAGEENNYVFGARLEEIEALAGRYDARAIYESNPRIARVVNTLIDGTLSDDGTGMFQNLYNSLVTGGIENADRYKVLLDFEDYTETKLRAFKDYEDRLAFGRKCLYNIARSGMFSSDRCIAEYASEIWKL